MADRLPATQRLTTLVLGWSFQPAAVEKLQTSFPDLNVLLATGSDLIGALPQAEAAVAWSLTHAELAAAKRLKWFQSIGAGVERVLLPEMREHGLIVTNTSGMHATNIAEHVLAMMLAFARCLPRLILAHQRAEWVDDFRPQIFELSGQRLHVVGYGEIGRRLAYDGHALGMRVTATRRQAGPTGDGVAMDIGGFDRLAEHLSLANHVAICLPQTAETIGLFDAKAIGWMKPGSYLYNIGRGPIVDTPALIAALESGHLGGAGLDVTDPEPLPSDSPLWQMPNVIITSHTAGSTPHFADRLTEIVIDNVRRFRAGETLRNVVDFNLGY